jgi:hypothetical protein
MAARAPWATLTYETQIARSPAARISLRQGARIVHESADSKNERLDPGPPGSGTCASSAVQAMLG